MTGAQAPYSQILRSTSIMGGVTVGVILMGMIRMKIMALLVGAAGIGLFGVYYSLVSTGAAIAGLGVGSSGVRQIAAAPEEERGRIRRAMWLMSVPGGIAGAFVVWALWEPLGDWMVGQAAPADAALWLGAAIFLTVIGACQAGILQGHLRVGALARTRVYGTLVGTVAGGVLVYFLRDGGILPALAAMPLSIAAIGFLYLRNLSSPVEAARRGVTEEWRPLLTLGLVLMSVALMSGGIQIVVRAMVVRELGLEAAGLYHGVVTASSSNVGLVLAALAADYFPRLSSVAHDRGAANDLVNKQLRVALLLAGPLLLGLAAGAPIALQLLYSKEFEAGTSMLRWFVAGDALKVAAWCLAFLLPATHSKKLFIGTEVFFSVAFVALTALLLPIAGTGGVGIAHLLANLLYLAVLVPLAVVRFGVALSRSNLALLASTLCLVLGVIAAASYSGTFALVGGLAATAGLGLYSATRLNELGGNPVSALIAGLKARSSRAR